MLWDITTKFLPVQDLIKSQLSTKFEEFSLKNEAATPLTISNFSRAWQAYFLSYTLQILCENTTFIDVQMMCNDDFDISSGFRFGKISVECSVPETNRGLCLQSVWISQLWTSFRSDIIFKMNLGIFHFHILNNFDSRICYHCKKTLQLQNCSLVVICYCWLNFKCQNS